EVLVAPVEVARLRRRRTAVDGVRAEAALERVEGGVEAAFAGRARCAEEVQLSRILQVVDADPDEADRPLRLMSRGEESDGAGRDGRVAVASPIEGALPDQGGEVSVAELEADGACAEPRGAQPSPHVGRE